MDVRVDWKCREAKRLRHDDPRGLVAHAGQRLECLEGCGNLAPVPRDQQLGEAMKILRFGGSEAARPYGLEDAAGPKLDHAGGRTGSGEEYRRDEIDPGVGRLGRERHRDEELKGIRVRERDGRCRKKVAEKFLNSRRLRCAIHP